MLLLYKTGELFCKLLFFLFTRPRVHGKENVPREGALLVVANHLSLVDPPLVGVSLGRKARFMAKKELFDSPLTKFFLTSVGAFPVNRERLGRDTLRQAEQALAQGLPLVMFPESTRSQNAQLKSALPGAAMLAARCGVPVLPVGIAGTEKINGIRRLLTRPRITVNIGAPFRLPSSNGKLTRDKLTGYTEIIMEHIAALLPAEYRGDYAPRQD